MGVAEGPRASDPRSLTAQHSLPTTGRAGFQPAAHGLAALLTAQTQGSAFGAGVAREVNCHSPRSECVTVSLRPTGGLVQGLAPAGGGAGSGPAVPHTRGAPCVLPHSVALRANVRPPGYQ